MVAIDPIANPWGVRTPFAPGEPWPQRVDSYLANGINAQAVDRWVQSAAVLHSNGDGLDIAVKDGRMVGVRGRAIDRVKADLQAGNPALAEALVRGAEIEARLDPGGFSIGGLRIFRAVPAVVEALAAHAPALERAMADCQCAQDWDRASAARWWRESVGESVDAEATV